MLDSYSFAGRGSASGELSSFLYKDGSDKTKGLQALHFIGLALGGGKTNKTCLAIIEYYPKQNKVFLSRLFEKIRTEVEVSADQQIYRLISHYPGKIEALAWDAPLQIPKCMRCRLRCPGYEACKEPEIQWMWKAYRKRNKTKRPVKIFTPYTERCVEMHLSMELEEVFHVGQAMGANAAPLTARAHFLTRRLKQYKHLEVFPKASLWRVGRSLSIQKSYLRFHKHALGGEDARRAILNKLMEKNIAFIYQQDQRILIENSQGFDAFLCALTAVLKYRKQCEPKPRGFPKQESWIEVPKVDINWGP